MRRDDERQTKRLRVAVDENAHVPLVSVVVAYRVGSAEGLRPRTVVVGDWSALRASLAALGWGPIDVRRR